MRRIEFSSAFKKDNKRMAKRGVDFEKLDAILELLICNDILPARCRPHLLVGNWDGYWECHIAPDWLLIYDLDDANVLTLHRMGTHSDLFD